MIYTDGRPTVASEGVCAPETRGRFYVEVLDASGSHMLRSVGPLSECEAKRVQAVINLDPTEYAVITRSGATVS